jgi:UPF0755 protein
LLEHFQKKTSGDFFAEATASGRSFYDIVTMASIIEKEVRGEEDRQKVADIFWRRLGIGMALQADSTVNYATRKNLPSVTAKDLEVDSRYNTYKYPGLPPGPIANPGMTALIAAIRPLKNTDWFFLTDKDGNVHYAKTFDEHIRNKQKYLR